MNYVKMEKRFMKLSKLVTVHFLLPVQAAPSHYILK